MPQVTGDINEEHLTVSTSVVTLEQYGPGRLKMMGARCFVEGQPIRWTTDGTTPTTTVGTLAPAGSEFWLMSPTQIKRFQAVRQGASDAVLHVMAGSDFAP